MNDNRKQLRMLHHLAKLAGWHSIKEWFAKDAADFLTAAESWREIREGII